MCNENTHVLCPFFRTLRRFFSAITSGPFLMLPNCQTGDTDIIGHLASALCAKSVQMRSSVPRCDNSSKATLNLPTETSVHFTFDPSCLKLTCVGVVLGGVGAEQAVRREPHVEPADRDGQNQKSVHRRLWK